MFEKDYDIDLLKRIIEYNHQRYLAFKNGEYFEVNPDYEKVLKARYSKVSRIKRRFIYLLSRYDYIWFCTFTFSNDYINKCDRTKRDLIKSVINTHDFKYILNIDYGKKTEREHYHCIIGTNINFDVAQFINNNYPCFSKSILVKKGKDDFQRMSKYINKLTNHCIKATTKRQRILYNFKGYDNFCPSQKEVKLAYLLDYWNLFSEERSAEDVGLLDKAHITGNFCSKNELPIIDIMLTSNYKHIIIQLIHNLLLLQYQLILIHIFINLYKTKK